MLTTQKHPAVQVPVTVTFNSVLSFAVVQSTECCFSVCFLSVYILYSQDISLFSIERADCCCLCHAGCCHIWLCILSIPYLQMSLAEYKKRQRKLKPKVSEPERRAPSSAVTKAAVPSPSKNLINSPPPASVKKSTASGAFNLFLIS